MITMNLIDIIRFIRSFNNKGRVPYYWS